MNNQELLAQLNTLHSQGKLIGRFSSIPNEIYHHSDCPGISATKLGLISRSIKHYLHALDNNKSSEAMAFGSAFHDSILLPNLFRDQYILGIDIDKRSKANKELWEKFIETNKDKTILLQNDFDRIHAMNDVVKESQACSYLLSSGEAEVTFFWVDELTGILCKCRVDWLFERDGRYIIADFKTTRDSSRKKFQKTIVDFSYDRTAAFYCDGVSKCLDTFINTFALIAIESEAPYEMNLYCLGKESMNTGRLLYRSALQKYKEYLDNKNIVVERSQSKEFEEIDIPAWATLIENRS